MHAKASIDDSHVRPSIRSSINHVCLYVCIITIAVLVFLDVRSWHQIDSVLSPAALASQQEVHGRTANSLLVLHSIRLDWIGLDSIGFDWIRERVSLDRRHLGYSIARTAGST